MDSRVSILSAMPMFFGHKAFWSGTFDPKARLDPKSRHKALLNLTGSHRWGFIATTSEHRLSPQQITILDVGQGLLERGSWTNPSWFVEKWLAERCASILGLQLISFPERSGSLGFEMVQGPASTKLLQNAMATGRWPCEVTDDGALGNAIKLSPQDIIISQSFHLISNQFHIMEKLQFLCQNSRQHGTFAALA